MFGECFKSPDGQHHFETHDVYYPAHPELGQPPECEENVSACVYCGEREEECFFSDY